MRGFEQKHYIHGSRAEDGGKQAVSGDNSPTTYYEDVTNNTKFNNRDYAGGGNGDINMESMVRLSTVLRPVLKDILKRSNYKPDRLRYFDESDGSDQ